MAKIRLTKIFTFDMAHSLYNHDGLCKNIHGHTYVLHVTLSGSPLQREGHPKDGMVIDFKVLKQIVKENILDIYDHALVLNENTPPPIKNILSEHYHRVVVTRFQPTCELLIQHFAGLIEKALPESIDLQSLKLHETPTSYCEWFATDNS